MDYLSFINPILNHNIYNRYGTKVGVGNDNV